MIARLLTQRTRRTQLAAVALLEIGASGRSVIVSVVVPPPACLALCASTPHV